MSKGKRQIERSVVSPVIQAIWFDALIKTIVSWYDAPTVTHAVFTNVWTEAELMFDIIHSVHLDWIKLFIIYVPTRQTMYNI